MVMETERTVGGDGEGTVDGDGDREQWVVMVRE